MAYTTAFRDRSSNVARHTKDEWASSVNTPVPQLNTTPYWQAQGKEADARVWTFNTTEPIEA